MYQTGHPVSVSQDMDENEFRERLSSMRGVFRSEIMPDGLLSEVSRIEASVVSVSGGMRMECRGMSQCARMSRCAVVFTDDTFPRPDEVTLEMVDDGGAVIGHDVPECMRESLKPNADLIWVSDSFVIHAEKARVVSDVRMVISASPLAAEWIPEGVSVSIYYPCVESAELINRHFGVSGRGVSTMIVGADGLESGCSGAADQSPEVPADPPVRVV